MPQLEYVVTQVRGEWTIRLGDRQYDLHATQEEAIQRALRWARNGIVNGCDVGVVINPADPVPVTHPIRVLAHFWREVQVIATPPESPEMDHH